jgi:hypothetical protein
MGIIVPHLDGIGTFSITKVKGLRVVAQNSVTQGLPKLNKDGR